MKGFYNLLIILMIFILAGCSSPSSDSDKQRWVVGVSAEYPPFEFHSKGEIIGFDIDLIQAIGKELNVEIHIKDMSFANLIPALQTGKIDLAISGFNITPERQKNIDFSKQYYDNSLSLVYLKENATPHLNNKKLGVQLGTTMEKWAKKIAKTQKVEIISLDLNPTLIEKLKQRHIDYLVIETVQAIEYCKHNPQLTYYKVGTVEEGYGIALPKNSPYLTKINQALETLEKNGTLKKLEEKWVN